VRHSQCWAPTRLRVYTLSIEQQRGPCACHPTVELPAAAPDSRAASQAEPPGNRSGQTLSRDAELLRPPLMADCCQGIRGFYLRSSSQSSCPGRVRGHGMRCPYACARNLVISVPESCELTGFFYVGETSWRSRSITGESFQSKSISSGQSFECPHAEAQRLPPRPAVSVGRQASAVRTCDGLRPRPAEHAGPLWNTRRFPSSPRNYHRLSSITGTSNFVCWAVAQRAPEAIYTGGSGMRSRTRFPIDRANRGKGPGLLSFMRELKNTPQLRRLFSQALPCCGVRLRCRGRVSRSLGRMPAHKAAF